MGNKFWYVALNEYRNHVFRKQFLLAVFSVPLLLGVSFIAGLVAMILLIDMDPVGYVDQAGILADPVPVPEEIANGAEVEMIAFPNEAEAESALEAEEIQAYYLLPEDYLDTREVTLVYFDEPGENAENDFFQFLQANISADIPEDVRLLVMDEYTTSVRSLDGSREFNLTQIFNLILPIVFGFLFTFVLTSGAGYLANAVTEEKENRTVEILSTSMSANQFILGKVLGIVMVIFTQVMSWLGFFVAAYFGAKAVFEGEWIQAAEIDFRLMLSLLLIFIPAFFFFSGIALTISSTVTESSEGQQAVALISMPVSFSYWFAILIISNPNSPFSVGLSLFPLTAPTLMPLRFAVGIVPVGQVIACVAILSLCAVFSIWLAARAYEIGLMQYGKRIRIGELLRGSVNRGRLR